MRRVVRTPQARADLAEILDHLNALSARAADRLAVAINRRVALLAAQPLTGRPRDELRPGLRSVVVAKYVLFYRVSDADVTIVRVLHGARDFGAAFDGHSDEG